MSGLGMDSNRPSYPQPPPPPPHRSRAYYGGPASGTAALTPTSASTAGSFPSPPGAPTNAQVAPGYAHTGSRYSLYPHQAKQEYSSPANAKADPRRDEMNGEAGKKERQKRNKPTLSCHECVKRKVKCDRSRPHCLACIKRQTECVYSQVASLIEDTARSATDGRRMTKRPKKKAPSAGNSPIPNIADRSFSSRGAVALSIGLLSNVPYSVPKSSNVFGIGSKHPFANYWTCEGGLPEVVAVLPDKIQADILIQTYFECVDPVYPMIHRQTFYADYAQFWASSAEEKNSTDASLIALIFIMLALGTQFVAPSQGANAQKSTAEFYASASNQALRMFSYLSTASIKSIQAMVLMTYFLINDNHASDGWAFAGILGSRS